MHPLARLGCLVAVDTLLVMKRTERYRTLASRQRYGSDLAEMTIEYNADSRTLSAGLKRSEADDVRWRPRFSHTWKRTLA